MIAINGAIRVIDFRAGRMMWGHAMHRGTFQVARHKNWIHRVVDRLCKARRYSFMCHVSPAPKIGDTVMWTAERGEVTATIYDVKQCRDPLDMFTIFVVVNGSWGDRS